MPNRPAVDYKQDCKSAVFAAPQEAGGVSADRNLIHWRRAVWVEAGKACVSTTFICHAGRSKFVPTGIARVCVIRHNKPKSVITTLIFLFRLGNPFPGCFQPLAGILPVVFS